MSKRDRLERMEYFGRHSYQGRALVSELETVLFRMIDGKSQALDNRFTAYKPTLIISSMRTLRDGSKVTRGFYVDYRNPAQVERAEGIEREIRTALASGDGLRIRAVNASLIEYTRSRYE